MLIAHGRASILLRKIDALWAQLGLVELRVRDVLPTTRAV